MTSSIPRASDEALTGDPATELHSSTVGPTKPSERILVLDVLRGFALLGIVPSNWAYGVSREWIRMIDEGAFWTAFSFLFGVGFGLQLIRAEVARRPFVLRYLWRIAILAAIGIVHRIFIYGGDILLDLAVMSVPLLLVRRWPSNLLLAFAAVCLLYSLTPQTPDGRVWVWNRGPQPAQSAVAGRPAPPTWCPQLPGLTDRYRRLVCRRAGDVRALLTDWLANAQGGRGRQMLMLCLFLLGLYTARRRLLDDVRAHTRLIVGVAIVALAAGLLARSLELFRLPLPEPFGNWRLRGLGNLGLALFNLSVVALAFAHWRLARVLLTPLAVVGRMSLTNYLMQSVVFAVVLGQGFGLIGYGEGARGALRGWPVMLVLLGVFALQILYSTLWFRRYEIGPVEWAWRSLTWFRLQPLRKQTGMAA